MKFESILSEPFAALEAFDKLVVTAFYLTIVMAVLFFVAAVLVKKLKSEKLPALFTAEKYLAVGLATSFGVMMVTLKISELIAGGELYKELFWPIMSVLIVIVALLAAGGILSLVKPEFLPKYKFIAFTITLIPLIVTIVMLARYYKTVAGYYTNVSQAGLYVSAVILAIILIGGSAFFGKKKTAFTTREMAYAAITLALAFALSYIKFFSMPQSGSITLASLLPLMIFSYMFGIRKGVIIGAVYGLLQAIQDPWIIHPAQFFLDYPIAFGMIGFAGIFHELGFFKKRPVIAFVLGAVLAVVLRYFCHVMSGIFAFSVYAQGGHSAVAWGFLYNTFAFMDMAIALVVGIMLFCSKSFSRMLDEKATIASTNIDISGKSVAEAQKNDIETPNNDAEAQKNDGEVVNAVENEDNCKKE